ncbi:MAG: 2-oxo acid dehydrogenase subunit E2 [Elusimicrobiota bacterium]|nr:2-oxo acid dehydrogenase subunit E2 [Elusimicrobiota bacterium]
MDYEFKLPDIGEGLVEGEIVKWFVKVGDTVAENQPLASILTDKAEVEIPSPKTGKVVKLFGKPGEKVKVHAPLATFDVAGNGKPAATAAKAAVAKPAPAPKVEAPAPAPAKAANGSGAFVFNLPDIGEGLVEGELVKWHVKEGASVSENQPLAAVLTDKAEVEIPSPKTGKILKLHAKPGEKVKVHSALVTFGGVSGATTAAAAAVGSAELRTAPAAAAASPRPASRQTEVLATPMVRKLAKDAGLDITLLSGTGPEGRVLEADVRGYKGAPAAPQGGDLSRVNATPAVKALAASLGVDVAALKGTGPAGRVVEGDVRAAAPRAKPGKPAPAPIVCSAAGPAAVGEERRPFAGVRRKIAERLSHSKRTVAHVTHMDECDMTALLALRDELKPIAAARGAKLTFLPFVMKALVKTLRQFPLFNASIDEERQEIVVKQACNLGIAVAAPQGLVVPVIKGADGKDLFGLAAEVNALAEKVRANKIDPASLQGGTFTITNIGPIGGLFATPIVNHPEVAILGLMKLQKRPVVRDGGIFARDMMNLVLSFDHRLVDGSDAAQFMNTLVAHLENPRTLL